MTSRALYAQQDLKLTAERIQLEAANVNEVTLNGNRILTTLDPIGGGGGVLPIFSQIVQVQKGGNDTTGDGTDSKPYLSITKAISTIVDASENKVYAIRIGPGTYVEVIQLKVNIYLFGEGRELTHITGTMGNDDPSWVGDIFGSITNTVGIVGINLGSGADIDFQRRTTQRTELYFIRCTFPNVNLIATATSAENTVIFNDSRLGIVYANGGRVELQDCYATDFITTSPLVPWGLYLSCTNGWMRRVYVVGEDRNCECNLYGGRFDQIQMSGSRTLLYPAGGSAIGVATFTNGATYDPTSQAKFIRYQPADEDIWNPPLALPSNVNAAIDAVANTTFATQVMSKIVPIPLGAYPLVVVPLTLTPLTYGTLPTLPYWLSFPAGVMTVLPGSYIINLNVGLVNAGIVLMRITVGVFTYYDASLCGPNELIGGVDKRAFMNTFHTDIPIGLTISIYGAKAAQNPNWFIITDGPIQIIKVA